MNGMIKSLSLVRIYFDVNTRVFAWIVVMTCLTRIMLLFINDLRPTSQHIHIQQQSERSNNNPEVRFWQQWLFGQ